MMKKALALAIVALSVSAAQAAEYPIGKPQIQNGFAKWYTPAK